MKNMKRLGLIALAASALLSLTGTASATIVTSPPGTAYTGMLTATSTNAEFDGPWVTIKCGFSEMSGLIEQHGPASTVSGKLVNLEFEKCNFPVTVNKEGTLEIHSISTTGNGTLTSSGAELLLHTSVGTCAYTTSSTDLGEVSGSNHTLGRAVFNLASAKIPRTSGSFLCGSYGVLTGTHTVTTPSALEVH